MRLCGARRRGAEAQDGGERRVSNRTGSPRCFSAVRCCYAKTVQRKMKTTETTDLHIVGSLSVGETRHNVYLHCFLARPGRPHKSNKSPPATAQPHCCGLLPTVFFIFSCLNFLLQVSSLFHKNLWEHIRAVTKQRKYGTYSSIHTLRGYVCKWGVRLAGAITTNRLHTAVKQQNTTRST